MAAWLSIASVAAIAQPETNSEYTRFLKFKNRR